MVEHIAGDPVASLRWENDVAARTRYAVLTKAALLGIAGAGFVAFSVAAAERVSAQLLPAPATSAAPTPSPSSSPVPTKKAGRFSLGVDTYTSGTNQQFVGPGVNGAAEIPVFQRGGPLAPSVPYDFFTGSPTTTGEAISQALILRPLYRLTNDLDIAVSLGYGSLGGSGNVGAYWGDALLPTIDPHLGSRAATVTPFFATHNGQDSVNASRLGVLSGSIALHDGRAALVGGYFDTKQTLPFVFAQAPWTNTPTQLAPQLPQSIGDAPPAVDVFRGRLDVLPLHGYDAWAKVDDVTFEATNADLPAMPGTIARESSLSGIYQAGTVTLGAEVAHLIQSGAVSGRVLFGGNSTISLDGTAVVPFSSVQGQRMTVVGFQAAAPIGPIDLDLRFGHSCYVADAVALAAAGCTSGNYYDATVKHGFGPFDLTAEFVRFEPTYAPAILPYGTLENVWSTPFAFPATWLHGDYQFVANRDVGANRQGVRLTTSFYVAGVEARFAVARYAQVSPYDLTTGPQSGFVEPYFSPQLTATQGVRGAETHAAAWFGWHPKFVEVTLELSDVITNRTAPGGRPQDNISVDYPSAVATVSHTFGRVLAGVGAARFGLHGSYDTSGTINADLSQNVVFSGLQYRANANSAYALEYQLFSVNGSPTIPGTLSPAYHGPQIQFYQRLKT